MKCPRAYTMKAGQYLVDTKANLPDGEPLDGDVGGHHVKVENAKAPGAGFVIDLTPATTTQRGFLQGRPRLQRQGLSALQSFRQTRSALTCRSRFVLPACTVHCASGLIV